MHHPRGSEEGNRYSPTGREILTGVTRTMIDVTAPRPEDIHIEDIAYSLAHQERFTGHCRLHPTIAQHSVACALIVQAGVARKLLMPHLGYGAAPSAMLRATLMHDASEMIVSDLSGAMKQAMRGRARKGVRVESWFDVYEGRAQRAIAKRYNCSDAGYEEIVHEADVLSCSYEMAWGGWCEDAKPPEWVVKLLDNSQTYRSADGGALDFLRCAEALGMML